MNIKDFAEKYIKAEEEAFQKFNFKLLETLEDPNVVYHIYPLPDLAGFETHKKQIGSWPLACSDLKQEWKYIIGDGNLFVLEYKARYISNGKFPNWPPAGKEATNDSLFIYRLNNGKVVEVWSNGTIKGIDMEAGAKKYQKQ
jgi:predicted ester cyclase